MFTFRVICSFDLQFSFSGADVELDPGGSDDDFQPTDAALGRLEAELAEFIGKHYSVESVEADAESDDLIGIEDLGSNSGPVSAKKATKKKRS